MIILKPDEMREMDVRTIEDGMPEILLMEAAGRGVAVFVVKEILRGELNSSLPSRSASYIEAEARKNSEILIFAGKGNNGGDGLVAGRFLDMWGYNVGIILLSQSQYLQGVNLTNYKLCKNRGIEICEIKDLEEEEIADYIDKANLVIDAMLGTGLKGDVRGRIASVIDLINDNSSTPVLAVDIPSGLDGESGDLHGRAVKADFTATMAFNKLGLCIYPGRNYAGKVEVIDIGMPEKSSNKVDYNIFMLSKKEAASLLPRRSLTAHKGTFGKVGIVGGSPGMIGAPVLTGISALKTGTGLVKIAVPDGIKQNINSNLELMISGLKDDKLGIIEAALPQIKKLKEKSDLMALGPGLGKSQAIEQIIHEILSKFEIPLVLDADGINAISDLNLLSKYKASLILTPHPGEMARLIDCEIKEVQNNRINIVRNFVDQYNVCLILKGAATIIGLPDGKIYINPTGNEGMATAGSGDVLTGIISSLLAQGLKVENAAILGPFLHGMAGDMAKKEVGSHGLIAGDIIDFIPRIIKDLL